MMHGALEIFAEAAATDSTPAIALPLEDNLVAAAPGHAVCARDRVQRPAVAAEQFEIRFAGATQAERREGLHVYLPVGESRARLNLGTKSDPKACNWAIRLVRVIGSAVESC